MDNDAHRLANYNYNGRVISAVIRNGNVYGTQFHPEKSGAVGLKIICAVIELSADSDFEEVIK